MKTKLLLVLIAIFASLVITTWVSAQSGTGNPSDNDVNRVAKKLYCPVCPNTPLDVCETQACKDWRGQIRDQLGAGWSDQQIISYFVDQYGERILAEPERQGFTSLVWVLPVVVVLLGLLIVWQILKRWRAKSKPIPAASSNPAGIDPQVLAQIEREIREMD